MKFPAFFPASREIPPVQDRHARPGCGFRRSRFALGRTLERLQPWEPASVADGLRHRPRRSGGRNVRPLVSGPKTQKPMTCARASRGVP